MFIDAHSMKLSLASKWRVVDLATGLSIPKVIRCDDEKGVLTRYLTNAEGKVILDISRTKARTVTESGRFMLSVE
jgi:hypothetical protein